MVVSTLNVPLHSHKAKIKPKNTHVNPELPLNIGRGFIDSFVFFPPETVRA